jgi:hypothetical protein
MLKFLKAVFEGVVEGRARRAQLNLQSRRFITD